MAGAGEVLRSLRQAGEPVTHHDRQLLADLAALDRPAPEPLPLVTCAGCRHFTPDHINRMAGMVFCARFNGYNWPLVERWCREFVEVRNG